jgi:hypothetical protein
MSELNVDLKNNISLIQLLQGRSLERHEREINVLERNRSLINKFDSLIQGLYVVPCVHTHYDDGNARLCAIVQPYHNAVEVIKELKNRGCLFDEHVRDGSPNDDGYFRWTSKAKF